MEQMNEGVSFCRYCGFESVGSVKIQKFGFNDKRS